MNNQPLVSLICSCYNSQEYIERFLISLIEQTYENIQIIIVDDGSIDETYSFIKKFEKKINNKFNELIILKQENGGAGSAYNNALKFVKGKYITWADSDDVLLPTNIEKKVNFLEINSKFSMVLCKAQTIDFLTDRPLNILAIESDKQYENIFERLIYPGVPCYSGVFMIKTDVLFSRVRDKEIPFSKEVGQNWQLLLPVAYKNKCGYIQDILYNCYVRPDSHSRQTNYKKDQIRCAEQEKILALILEFIDEKEKDEILLEVEKIYINKRINLAFANKDSTLFTINYSKLKKLNLNVPKNILFKKIILTNNIFYSIYYLLINRRKK